MVALAVLSLLKAIVYTAGAVAVVYFGLTVPIRETAGQQTVLTVVYRAVIDMELHVVVPYVASAGFCGLWWSERRLRKSAVRRENQRNRELEKKIDPDRTSSGFTED